MAITPDDKTPILVGWAQTTQRRAANEALTPLQMITECARNACHDAGVGETLCQSIDSIALTRLAIDSTEFGGFGIGQYSNLPRSVANTLGITGLRHEVYCAPGGNTPQMLVNHMANRIASGETSVAFIGGSENLNTLMSAIKSGVKLWWDDHPGGEPIVLGETRSPVNDEEKKYGLFYPVNTYPLFENAIRAYRGRTIDAHQQAIGRLMSPLSAIAARNPEAWFPVVRTPEEIITPNDRNRWVSFPYTKYMCAVIQVDMAAGLIMTSVGKARELGIAPDRWIFLNGCADLSDAWFISDRVNYHSSPAIQAMGRLAFDMAGLSPSQLDALEIYSCFPSAIEIACEAFGIAEDDPRGLTVTGGLPYFGGPGNNYVMHAIGRMMQTLRAKPGSTGMVTANGWYLTKHSVGLYGTAPTQTRWTPIDAGAAQRTIDAMASPGLEPSPTGEARIETYTITHTPRGPGEGIVIGRTATGRRFFANLQPHPELLERLKVTEGVGLGGRVDQVNGRNVFTPAGG